MRRVSRYSDRGLPCSPFTEASLGKSVTSSIGRSKKMSTLINPKRRRAMSVLSLHDRQPVTTKETSRRGKRKWIPDGELAWKTTGDEEIGSIPVHFWALLNLHWISFAGIMDRDLFLILMLTMVRIDIKSLSHLFVKDVYRIESTDYGILLSIRLRAGREVPLLDKFRNANSFPCDTRKKAITKFVIVLIVIHTRFKNAWFFYLTGSPVDFTVFYFMYVLKWGIFIEILGFLSSARNYSSVLIAVFPLSLCN